MATNDGSIQFIITPNIGHGENLFRELKIDYPRCYLYTDGFFIYLKTNTDCSHGFFKKLEKNILIKSIALNQECNPKNEDIKIDNIICERENWEKGKVSLDNAPTIKARIKIRPERNTNLTVLFENLNHVFPKATVDMIEGYITLVEETERISDLIIKVQAMNGVELALYA